MTYTKKQFLEDVAAEATALKEHATAEELAKLDFSNLSANDVARCVYGQMTGYCDSERASILIMQCAPKLYNALYDGQTHPIKDFETFYWSPIEKYILGDDAKNANLIAFLKGERKDLVL